MDAVYMSEQNITSIADNYTPPLEALEAPTRRVLVFVFTATAVLAFFGNVIVIVVALLDTRSAKILRMFLIKLAISDILLAVICVPFTYTDFKLGQWIFPLWLCPLTQFVQILSVFVTTFTLTVIAIERLVRYQTCIVLITQFFLGGQVSGDYLLGEEPQALDQ